jgi:hypothetical protein
MSTNQPIPKLDNLYSLNPICETNPQHQIVSKEKFVLKMVFKENIRKLGKYHFSKIINTKNGNTTPPFNRGRDKFLQMKS